MAEKEMQGKRWIVVGSCQRGGKERESITDRPLYYRLGRGGSAAAVRQGAPLSGCRDHHPQRLPGAAVGAAAGYTVTVRGLVSQQTGSRRVCFYGQRANTAFPGQTRSSHGPSTTTCSLSTFISWAVFVDCIRFLSSNLTHGIWTRRRRRRTIYDHSISR